MFLIISEQSVGKFWLGKINFSGLIFTKILQRIIVQKMFFLLRFFSKKNEGPAGRRRKIGSTNSFKLN